MTKLSKNPLHNNNHQIERHVVLVAPEIHWNTGNIGRTCLATDAYLHLIKPLGFSLESREVKRAGLDYWENVRLTVWDNFDDFLENTAPQKDEVAVFSKRGSKSFWTMTCPKAPISDIRIGNPRASRTYSSTNMPMQPITYPSRLISDH